MALIKPIHGEMKGSIAGNTFQGGRFGMVVRQRRKPVDPATTAQGTVRVNLAEANKSWLAVSQIDRDNWGEYAQNTPWTNLFGDEVLLTGRQMYIRTNTFRLQGLIGEQATAPVTPGLPANPDFGLTADETNGLELTNFDVGTGPTDLTQVRYAGPFAISRLKHKGPWRQTFYINSDETDPFNLIDSAEVTTGQIYFVSVRHMDPDGRLSPQTLVKRIITNGVIP